MAKKKTQKKDQVPIDVVCNHCGCTFVEAEETDQQKIMCPQCGKRALAPASKAEEKPKPAPVAKALPKQKPPQRMVVVTGTVRFEIPIPEQVSNSSKVQYAQDTAHKIIEKLNRGRVKIKLHVPGYLAPDNSSR